MFIVEKDGSLSYFKPIESSKNELGEELIRALKTAEKWSPGMQNEKLTTTRYLAVLSIKADTISKNLITPGIDAISITKY
ncbi:energy transducer TonB [Flavobacterium sp. UGB4466]|uniref:energy transducer TonB n=1 Tax=Flavobacterium sp. UGB4466 TaxID=2730889 RepID=UPI00192B8707|nr:hypothetical protein [Flavobacterium sp. UGB4466]